MQITRSNDRGFAPLLSSITRRGAEDTSAVEAVVRSILDSVRDKGDRAVIEYTKKFDGVELDRKGLLVSPGEIETAAKSLSKKDITLLELAACRIEAFHKKQMQNSWFTTDETGIILGSKVTPLERAGIYVPGGKAAYPSTVLMNAIPARVAGVDEVVMVTPPGRDGINPMVLAAAKIAGVDKVYRVGGAQAIGALAFGTSTIPKVDKITGPGNIYVATAKRLVFGTVDIDMVAGPSEILIINDGTGDPSWIAIDLLSQAEHDELASSILITTSEEMATAVSKEVASQLKKLKRRKIAGASIERYGVIIIAKDLTEAAAISNRIAPEHLELFVEEPFELLGLIRNAGAVFMGKSTPEAAGDYLAGPNHTLPTGGTARWSGGVSVESFQKTTTFQTITMEGLRNLAPTLTTLAEAEGLEAHKRAVAMRLKTL